MLVSEIGRPIVSKPHVRPRSCSIFCCARITVNVFERAATVLRVEIANSCASDTRPTQSSSEAIITSASEKPVSSVKRDLAKAVHSDGCHDGAAVQDVEHREGLRRRESPATGCVPPALTCAVPSGQNSTVCTSLPKPTPSGSVWIGPSLFGTAEDLRVGIGVRIRRVAAAHRRARVVIVCRRRLRGAEQFDNAVLPGRRAIEADADRSVRTHGFHACALQLALHLPRVGLEPDLVGGIEHERDRHRPDGGNQCHHQEDLEEAETAYSVDSSHRVLP